MTQIEFETIGLIKEIYKTYPTGGALHIVLDDGNDEDHWIKYCITDKCFEDCKISDNDQWLFVRCAELLLSIDICKRNNIIYQAHKEIREERAKQPKSESGIKLSSEKLSGVIIAKKEKCPMNDINLSPHDFGTLAICAIRYCHGRMSYMPDMVRDIIRPNLDRISDKDLNIMLEDCEFQRQTQTYGDEKIDKPGWIEWKNQLKAERERRNNDKRRRADDT